jgi:glutamine transport system substrate-binding protein
VRHALKGLRAASILLAGSVLALASACVTQAGPATGQGSASAGGVDAAHTPSGPTVAALVVASDLDNMPFAGVDEAGTPIGRDVEMMEAIGEALGRPIRWHRADFETLLPSAQGGWPDVVCATIGVTQERARKVAFSRPYFETVIAVVVRAGAGEPRGWDDLNGKLVAAGTGTTAEVAVRLKLPRAVLAPTSKQNLTSAERLLLGEVDGIAMDGPNADALVADSGGALTTLHTALIAERYALVVPRDRTDLLSAINAALLDLERSGQMKRWNGKWGLRPIAGSPNR